tara:strand:- start:43 stop:219 length:177 start_codon:yes stop_codon:yes gene_type:complete
MPAMDGFVFCENVKRDEKLKIIPFVFSNASFKEGKDEALALKLGQKSLFVSHLSRMIF